MTDTGSREQATGSFKYLAVICLVATLGGLLFGYDTAVISGAIGFLQEHFGLSAAMKGWAASSALVGCIIGVTFAGILSDYLGRRRVMILSAVAFLVSAVGSAVPRTLTTFVVYRIIGGLGVGAASMTCPLYIAEVAPARMRGRLVSWNQFAIVAGMLVVYFVNYFIARIPDDPTWNVTTGWRWMFGSESLPALLFLACLFLVPESPRWLVRQRRFGEAQGVLTRIDGAEYAECELTEISRTVEKDAVTVGQLFSAGWLPVLLIGVALAVLQQITGINVMLYYGPEIFKETGVQVEVALLWTILMGGVMVLFTVVAIKTVDRLGRRPLMLTGAAGMGACLLATGLAFHLHRTGAWTLVFILGYIAFFSISVGPVTWVILSEIFPTRIRGRAMGIATFLLWAANYVVSQTFPIMDENERLVAAFNHGFPFWVYGIFCAVLFAFVWRFVPETKGRTLEDIERQWMRKER